MHEVAQWNNSVSYDVLTGCLVAERSVRRRNEHCNTASRALRSALADSGGEIAVRFPLPKRGPLVRFCGHFMPPRFRGGNIESAPFFLKTNPMKPFLRSLLVCTLSAGATISAAKGAEVMYENPVLPGDHPDPSIIRVGRDYWASYTSSEWGPQFPLLHSRDLINWRQTGAVFFTNRPDWAVGNFWAPEISHFKNRYHVYYVGREKNGPLAVAVADADKPEGPYTDRGPMVAQPQGSIDPASCLDEHGTPYLIWKDDNNSVGKTTTIWAQPMNDDGTKLTGQPTALIHNDTDWEGAVVEGPYVLERSGWFYLFYSGAGCCGSGCNYAMGVARSHALLGPWEKNPANPILAANDRWKCPGHGSIVTDERGRYWLLHHAYPAPNGIFTGREGMLEEVIFATNDWPTINQGYGPVIRGDSPQGSAQSHDDLAFLDDFKRPALRLGWQWPQDRQPKYALTHGQLILYGAAQSRPEALAAVLAHSAITADYTATTVIDTAHLAAETSAGLAVVGDEQNAVGLSIGKAGLVLWRRDRGHYQSLAQTNAPAGSTLRLRLQVAQGNQFHFTASADGKHWQPVGEGSLANNLPPWDRSVRVALTVEGTDAPEARFNSFRLVPDTGK
jgi:beta-xylosidase